MIEIRKLSIDEILNCIDNGSIKAQEVYQAFFNAIQDNQDLKAFITICSDSFKNEGKLRGLPIAVKDLISTKNILTTCGSRMLADYLPPYNATVVNRLLEAGASIIGKTNLDEFGMGSSGENSFFGITENPWDKTRVAGGSSSGSAAAVAAGLVPVALATDTGGSIRQPAAFCGVSGLKPTYGRISRYGVVAFASSLDQVGILAHNAEDLAMVYKIIAGYDEKDATSINKPVFSEEFSGHLKNNLAGLKIGLPKEYFQENIEANPNEKNCEADDAVFKAVKQAIKKLEKAGATIVEISLPHLKYAVATYYIISMVEAASNLSRYDGLRFGLKADSIEESRSSGFGKEVKRRILIGTYLMSKSAYDQHYLKAQRMRRLITEDFKEAFKTCDIIASPVTPTMAFKIGEIKRPLDLYLQDLYTVPASLAGLPAMSIPCGFAPLPIGLQLIGNYWQEESLLNAAYAYQQLTTWHKELCF